MLNAESTTPGSSAGTQVPWSVFSPSMASFLKRTANASFVPRLLSIGPSMSARVYRGLRGCNLRCRGRITTLLVQGADFFVADSPFAPLPLPTRVMSDKGGCHSQLVSENRHWKLRLYDPTLVEAQVDHTALAPPVGRPWAHSWVAEFSNGTMGNFRPELTYSQPARE